MHFKKAIKFTGKVVVASFAVCTLASCNSESSDKSKEVKDSIPAAETTKDKVSNIFYSIPSPIQLGQLMQKAGATYNKEMLNPPGNLASYSTSNRKAMNLGVYGADMSYAAVFNQIQETRAYLNNSKKLADELGIASSFTVDMMKRMEKNEGNKDSLLQIISELFLNANESLKDNKQSNISLLVLAGGFVEGMYIGTQAAKNVKDNEAIYKRIGELRGSLNNLIMMFNLGGDGEVADVLDDLKSIKDIYGDAPAAASKVTATVDTTKKTMTIGGGKSNYSLSKEQIEKLTAQVAVIRTKIVKP